MKSPPATPRRRPPQATLRPPRTRTEAAVSLVRAEFERERLERDLAQLAARAEVTEETLAQAMGRSRRLRELLTDPEDRAPAPRRRR